MTRLYGAVLVDPLQSNARARRFYEPLDFRLIENRRFGQHDCATYRLDRGDFTPDTRIAND